MNVVGSEASSVPVCPPVKTMEEVATAMIYRTVIAYRQESEDDVRKTREHDDGGKSGSKLDRWCYRAMDEWNRADAVCRGV